MGPNVKIGSMQNKFVSVKGSNHMAVNCYFPNKYAYTCFLLLLWSYL